MPRRRTYGGGYGWGRNRRYGHDPYYGGGHYQYRRSSSLGTVIGCVAALFFGVIALLVLFLMVLL